MSLLRQVLHYLNLEGELDDYERIHSVIEKDIVFRGTNLWILIFAIVVASVGLNMNSTAVIIGAMLISPLMGPINGIGYSIATYNTPLFKTALKNFSFAVATSLVTSTVYFAISPVSTAHSELLARTSPTIYDVLIALFGGFAGIVAISSRQKGNVIPGVAIATALMPPLCTAGYGLATAQFEYFFGAFYLFTINTVFIAFAALLVSQLLKFPIRTLVDQNERVKVNRWISVVITITVVPSIYFGYGLVQKERFSENASRYTSNVSVFQGSYLLKSEINSDKKTINLVYGGAELSEESRADLRKIAQDFKLEKALITFTQGFSTEVSEKQSGESESLKAEIYRLRLTLSEIEKEKEAETADMMTGRDLLQEIRAIWPQVEACTYSDTYTFIADEPEPVPVKTIVLKTSSRKLAGNEKERISNWLKSRLKSEDLIIHYEE